MPDALWFTDDPEACKLLAHDPFALLVGFAIDQQVTVQKAFAGPLVLQERVGTLDPRQLAEPRPDGGVRDEAGDPPLPRRDGDAACASSRRWSARSTTATPRASGARPTDSADLKRRIGALPGFGEMKVKSLSAVLAKQFGVQRRPSSRRPIPRWATSPHPRSSTATSRGSASTRRRRKVPESPEQLWQRAHDALSAPPVEEWDTWPFAGRVVPRALEPPVDAEPQRHGAGGVDCRRCAKGVEGVLWHDDNWVVDALDQPTGLPCIVLLHTRQHVDFPDLPAELARELGPMLIRVQRAVFAIGDIGNVHVCRWGDGSEHCTSGSWRAPRASRS